ncbi:hypothetical protein SHAM105786_08495 [Shewanella amazonensis]
MRFKTLLDLIEENETYNIEQQIIEILSNLMLGAWMIFVIR